MAVKVYINGSIHDEADASISVFDRGFLYGDSVYEVMRTSRGRPVDLERHLDRLGRSAEALALRLPSDSAVRSAIAECTAAASNDESYVRIVVTRGAGEVGLDTALADEPTLIVIVKPLTLPSAEMYERGVSLRIVGVQRTSRRAVDPGVKSGNYLNNILALAEAKRAGAYEAIMCDVRGRIAEGSSSNVFLVRGGDISTPSLEIGLLAGITRGRIMELARGAGLRVHEESLSPADLLGADEVFITSSIRGLLPVSRVDEVPLAAPGPVTAKLMELYREFLASEAGA